MLIAGWKIHVNSDDAVEIHGMHESTMNDTAHG